MTKTARQLMAISDRRLMDDSAYTLIRQTAQKLGANFWLVVREKDLDGQELYSFSRKIQGLLKDTDAHLLINHRLDVAISLGSQVGVQLPESGLPLEAVRRYAGTERILGRSVHDLAGAQEAAAQGADIVIAAPVFEVPGKGPALGLNGMKKMHEAIQGRALLFALGGIEQHKLDELSPFVDGFAAIRSIWRNDLVHAPVFLLDQSPPGPT